MSANRKTVVGVIFGGRSVEHEVSVVTGSQIMRAFDPERYDVVPIYIDREGRWFTGAPLLDLKNFRDEVISMSGVSSAILSPDVRHHGLIVNPTAGLFSKSEIVRLDAVFPAIHGSHGEDGTLQGLLELADIPYVGCGVLASAIANDKITTKTILRQKGIRVTDSVDFTRVEWYANPDAIIGRISQALTYPMFVKPATIGSSIGITRPTNEVMLRQSIEIAVSFDRRIVVESAVTESIEINCALLGDERDLRASVLEQPVSWEEFLTYEEKYLRGGEGMKSAERVIPAQISPELTQAIQKMALDAFRAIDGRGTARIDFLVRPELGEIYLNELNSMPGSVAFYLWQEEGLTARDVVQRLVELAREAQAEKRQTTYNYRTRLLEQAAIRGVKGSKVGSKPSAKSQS